MTRLDGLWGPGPRMWSWWLYRERPHGRGKERSPWLAMRLSCHPPASPDVWTSGGTRSWTVNLQNKPPSSLSSSPQVFLEGTKNWLIHKATSTCLWIIQLKDSFISVQDGFEIHAYSYLPVFPAPLGLPKPHFLAYKHWASLCFWRWWKTWPSECSSSLCLSLYACQSFGCVLSLCPLQFCLPIKI